MGKISRAQRRKGYFKIYEQIYESPIQSITDISQNTGISRNTVAKYLQEMYAQGILFGPYIKMKPAKNYREYVYLLNFSNPFSVLQGLKGFPHVLHCAVTFGGWNIIVTTDKNLDFSRLVGFKSMVARGVKGFTSTPKVEHTSWSECFQRVCEKIKEFTPFQRGTREHTLTFLDWGKDEWKLYHAFKSNAREKVTPLLRKIKVQYEIYTKWGKNLENHCTVHTEFYPEGFQTYLRHCFLFSSDYRPVVRSLFSLFPTSSVITEVGDQLLGYTHVPSPDIIRRLFCTIYDMQTVKMIKRFSQAVVLSCYNATNRMER